MNQEAIERTDVLIVGAGPTGLALAITLARAGVQALLVDRLAGAQNTSRAAVVHAHTLEVLDRIGVADELVTRGRMLSRFTVHDRDRPLLRLRFDHLPCRHSGLLMLPQDVTEAVLADALSRAGGAIRRNATVTALFAEDDGVEVVIATPDAERRVRARYVVGADGMHSVVRGAAGIGFTGEAYEQSFVLADVAMRWPAGDDDVKLFFSPAGLLVVAPLPGGTFRIVATLADAPPQPGVGDVQALLDQRGPQHGAGQVDGVHWSSRFRVHHRVADRYRSGRFLLVGDAAHVHSPAGGQGMNTGLVDACVLGELLADVVRGRRPDAWLDHYERLRRPAAVQVLALAGGLTRMALVRSSVGRSLRNLRLRLVDHLPFACRRITLQLSGLARRAAAVLP